MKKNDNNKKSRFMRVLFAEIEKKKKMKEKSHEFQDLHWDDVYSVYYDSSK